mgnify:CR=1 FL=1
MIRLDYRDSRPIYEQVRDGLRRLMVTGVMQPGEQLPSVRSLAMELAINPNTIQRAYAQLEQELLAAINALGIGPQGFGGRTTCLGLSIEQMPTHVAGLPAAVNVSCHVTRRASAEL